MAMMIMTTMTMMVETTGDMVKYLKQKDLAWEAEVLVAATDKATKGDTTLIADITPDQGWLIMQRYT